MVNRYVHGEFREEYVPSVEIVVKKKLFLDGEEYKLYLVDTEGSADFAWVGPSPALSLANDLGPLIRSNYISAVYLKTSAVEDCFVFCFSLEDVNSFLQLATTISGLVKTKKTALSNLPIVVIGCKSDLPDRQVTEKEIAALIALHSVKYFETSARDNLFIDEAFEWLVRSFLIQQRTALEKSKREAMSLSLVDACACEIIFPKIIDKKLKVKGVSAVNVFMVGALRSSYQVLTAREEWEESSSSCYRPSCRADASTSSTSTHQSRS